MVCALASAQTHFFFLKFFNFFAACGILFPQPGMEPGPTALKARSPNHGTAREFPAQTYFKPASLLQERPCVCPAPLLPGPGPLPGGSL